MCGIVGVWTPKEKIDREVLLKMRDTLRHRGPDDAGIFIDEEANLGLGHSRLSIIDLTEAAHQPMLDRDYRNRISTDNKLWIVYNGEVYNFREIKKELEKKGYKFFSDSDTEVVLKSFKEWGSECVQKFRGMFAFAVWDSRKQKLYLLRDRFGVKPLYYCAAQGEFIFASELKAIYSWPQFKKQIDFTALNLYLQLGYIPAPLTIFKNTYKLEEGTGLEIDKRLNLKQNRYFYAEKYFQKDKTRKPEQEILFELERILEESFQYRLIADVPVGLFLSGGIDSSLIAALLAKNYSGKIKTFSIGFSDPAYDESPKAGKVAEILGTEHYEYYVSAKDLAEVFEDYSEIFDEPFGDRSGLPTYLLAKFAGEKVKAALSGDGGDELFLGYDKYRAVEKIREMTPFWRRRTGEIIQKVGPGKIARIYSLASRILSLPKYSNIREKTLKLTNLLKEDNGLARLFQSASSYWTEKELNKLFSGPVQSSLEPFFPEEKNISSLEQMQLWDIKNYLADDILVKTDRPTMACGLEAREPYLDQHILEYAANLPIELKYKKHQTKYLLKKILSKYLPPEIAAQPKAGFNIPIYQWLRKDWQEALNYYLGTERIKRLGIFNADVTGELIKKHNQGKYVNPDKLWILLAFSMWHQKWVE